MATFEKAAVPSEPTAARRGPRVVFVANNPSGNWNESTARFVDDSEEVVRFNWCFGKGGASGSKTTMYIGGNPTGDAFLSEISAFPDTAWYRSDIEEIRDYPRGSPDHDPPFQLYQDLDTGLTHIADASPRPERVSYRWPSAGFWIVLWAMRLPRFAGHEFVLVNFSHCEGNRPSNLCHDFDYEEGVFNELCRNGRLRRL